MAQRVEDRLHELELLRADPLAAASLTQLRRALADRSNLIASKAAALIEEFEIQALATLAGDLARAFDRFLEGGAKLDPQCWAKNALIKALKRLNHQDHERYLRAFRYTQREPVFDAGQGLSPKPGQAHAERSQAKPGVTRSCLRRLGPGWSGSPAVSRGRTGSQLQSGR